MYMIAHSFAELAGRTRPNIHDLQQAFTDMNLHPASLESYVKKASQSKIPLLRGPLKETIPKVQKKKEQKTVLLDSDIEDNSDSEDEEPQQQQQQQPLTTAAGPTTTSTSTPTSTANIPVATTASTTTTSTPTSTAVPTASVATITPTIPIPKIKVTPRTIVPDHLPPFPSKHSYKQTPVFVKRPTDPQKIRELNAEQSRLVESNLKRLMAAENKVGMTAAAHKDASAAAADLLMVKEEQVDTTTEEAVNRRVLTKLEALPVVNYEFTKRQQQLNASNRQSSQRHQAELQGLQSSGHHHQRAEPLSSLAGYVHGVNSVGPVRGNTQLDGSGTAIGVIGAGASSIGVGTVASSSANNSAVALKTEWRKERRRMRREQQNAIEELEQNLHSNKRLRQESGHGHTTASHLKLVSMDVDPQ
ncbi:transcription factor TFIID complex subunit 8 C-term-domain-containing protein [Lobosporangium transversale]|uniref:Transcription initiation factor TFIID subunit 8 n=1 Tax=Lobosporangium transversale TaxID=64571 RepID=A0A1Y2GM02_9FUNG|nr:transcription factor TFIID complex subunit 8 C-term-domain-containing protein [Lobosporangium transversale]ORZ15004.1 transcription factor TFIID complex subunit 8 C-term-domain-containing protein [Lobosporangium transversale]|eukprot:XP_021881136.1 transcription factor TFIID complex subunit 8 C-term-domain-containing protein [Lobosporangium transversale]